jgi:hypothetical protein
MLEDFDQFFAQEIAARKSKTFKTKKRLESLINNEILHSAEETEGTTIQNSNDNVEDILKRNETELRDIPMDKVKIKYYFLTRINNSFDQIKFFYDFRMTSLVNCKKLLACIKKNCKYPHQIFISRIFTAI